MTTDLLKLAASHAQRADDCGALARAVLAAAPQPAPLTKERMHEVLGSAGPDLLALAQQWADNKVHVYEFVQKAEAIVRGVLARAGGK